MAPAASAELSVFADFRSTAPDRLSFVWLNDIGKGPIIFIFISTNQAVGNLFILGSVSNQGGILADHLLEREQGPGNRYLAGRGNKTVPGLVQQDSSGSGCRFLEMYQQ